MTGAIHRYLAEDHRRLEDALRRATRDSEHIDGAAYLEFRGGLLRHIGMEERFCSPLRMPLVARLFPSLESFAWIMARSPHCSC